MQSLKNLLRMNWIRDFKKTSIKINKPPYQIEMRGNNDRGFKRVWVLRQNTFKYWLYTYVSCVIKYNTLQNSQITFSVTSCNA